MLALSGMQQWVRPGVFIDATTITEDAQGLGAFAPRGSITRKSSFLGVYRATKWRVQKRRYSGSNDYVMQCGDWLAIRQGRMIGITCLQCVRSFLRNQQIEISGWIFAEFPYPGQKSAGWPARLQTEIEHPTPTCTIARSTPIHTPHRER